MTDKEPLGLIRVVATNATPGGPFFDFPYYEETAFDALLTKIRADRYFASGSIFIPWHGIACVLKLPRDTADNLRAQRESVGETRQ